MDPQSDLYPRGPLEPTKRRTQKRGTVEVGVLGDAAAQPPGAVVALVASPAGPRRLDLRALVPLVVARDRDQVGACLDRAAPHRVVGGAVPPRANPVVAGRTPGVVAGPDGRSAQQPLAAAPACRAAGRAPRRRAGRRRCRGRRTRRRRPGPRGSCSRTCARRRGGRSAPPTLASGSADRSPDVEVRDAERAEIARCPPRCRDGPAVVGLQMRRYRDPTLAGRRDHLRQTLVLDASLAPTRRRSRCRCPRRRSRVICASTTSASAEE